MRIIYVLDEPCVCIALLCGACAGGRVPAGPGVHSALTVVVTAEGRSCAPLPTALQTLSISPHPRRPSLSPDPILHSAIVLLSVLLAATGPPTVLVFRGAQSEEVGSGLEDVLSWGVTHVALMTRLGLWVWGGSPQRVTFSSCHIQGAHITWLMRLREPGSLAEVCWVRFLSALY